MTEDVELLHMITEPTKYKIIQMLMQHNYCVRALARKLGISEPAVSQQLAVLKKYRVISGSKIGYQVHYQVNVSLIAQALQGLLADLTEKAAAPAADADCSCEFAADCIRYKNDRESRP